MVSYLLPVSSQGSADLTDGVDGTMSIVEVRANGQVEQTGQNCNTRYSYSMRQLLQYETTLTSVCYILYV